MALQINGRANNVELAGQLGTHVSTVAKWVEWLEENDFMRVRALPNPFKLGYNAQAIIGIKAKIPNIEKICARLNANFHVNLVMTTFGRYNILAIAYFSTWEMLLNMISADLTTAEGTRVDTFLIKAIKKRYYGFTTAQTDPVKVDDIDHKIIEKLTENGRYKNQPLARNLGISPPTCQRRLARLLHEKVIEIKAIPNPSEIGYDSNAFLFLQVQAGKLDEICALLQREKDVFLILTLYNSYNLVIGYNAASPEDLYQFQNQVLAVNGILNGDSVIRAKITKRYYGGFLT
jgi:Lrp/AsnC family transcriptional regulator, regulator for asnA, asnC and gidA